MFDSVEDPSWEMDSYPPTFSGTIPEKSMALQYSLHFLIHRTVGLPLRQKRERSKPRFTPWECSLACHCLLHDSLVSYYLSLYSPSQSRPVKDSLFLLPSYHLPYLKQAFYWLLPLHTSPLSTSYVGWVRWGPRVVVSIGPKEIIISPSP